MSSQLRALRRCAGPVAIVIVSLLAAGCGSKRAQNEPPPFRIVATDTGYEASSGLAAGVRHVVFENRGSDIHEAMFVKLPPGKTADDYVAAVKAGSLFPEGALDYSGPGLTSPGETVELWLKLDPGNYILICWNLQHAKTTPVYAFRAEQVGAAAHRPPKEDVGV